MADIEFCHYWCNTGEIAIFVGKRVKSDSVFFLFKIANIVLKKEILLKTIPYGRKFSRGKIFANGLKVRFSEKYFCEFGGFGWPCL